ncbi:sodium/potassium-transporting ATPase subunit gamma-like isoform X2 [Stegostoma tigrinum]|uniref:sodium/potassium-transporting ATPase subunit gamma-like isoform X2 n=1 Tax=Stegostoma tigrinum TaxID=3053191 RepID=UPI002870822C|nr:sodium/potassium-transporting ATPase subunit gamma-like isoform X2 [Stegostoma tigrinum]
MSGHSISKADMISSNQEQFTYDYDTLRTTGLILAVIMFVTGIVIALSKKFKCAKSSSASKTETPKTSIPGASENIHV